MSITYQELNIWVFVFAHRRQPSLYSPGNWVYDGGSGDKPFKYGPEYSIIATALRRSLKMSRKEWTTHPEGTRGDIHLFNAALAELPLQRVSSQ
jgi:hypothetical protein